MDDLQKLGPALRLLSPAEAAALLGLTVKTLAAWRTRGEGPPHVQVSRRAVRYQLADLQDWIDSRRRTSTSHRGGTR